MQKPSERIRQLLKYFMSHRLEVPEDMTPLNAAIIQYLDEQDIQREEKE